MQLLDVASVSARLPHVRSQASVDRAVQILTEIRTCLREWKGLRKRPVRFVILGIDANIRLPSEVAGITGNRCFGLAESRRLRKQQASEVLDFAEEFQLQAANAFPQQEPAEWENASTWT